MGKQGSPKSPRPGSLSFDASSGLKEYQLRWNEMLKNGDPSLGRRVSGGEYNWDKPIFVKGFKNDSVKYNASKGGSADSLMFSLFDPSFLEYSPNPSKAYDAKKDPEETVSKFWKEQFPQASTWKPCAEKNVKRAGTVNNHTGFILVSANGGLNQQRVAVCNAVAVASLLNATLVIPKFLYSNVWKDPSQFSDIYQEETFMYTLKDDINIIKELPSHLRSLDLEAIGSLVTDADLAKEATPDEYIKKYFLFYCVMELFISLDLAIDLALTHCLLIFRFEVDMVAYSMCDFGGGENETRELQAYREEHFPLLLERLKKMKPLSPAELRNMGRCPLTPEEAALVLAGLGFSRGTYIYLAGSQIYGGKSRMRPIISLYPNVVKRGYPFTH
ncbi:UNVERIFIED_CONTAM: O-fucosyltransferase 8 [Sesamum latifolium]|uniref:O-fucosyltransferase family protein n=1 Tax=Sesamum latifolium TaxID=2727402 RepID=A0AAW2WRZ3_9LAMI